MDQKITKDQKLEHDAIEKKQEAIAKEKKYKSKTQRKREWNPRAWAKKHLKDQGGMPTEQIRGMTSSEIDEYWKHAITCERCKIERAGQLFSGSKFKTGYLKLMFSWKFPFVHKKWFCSSCYNLVGGILLGFGDLGGIKPVRLHSDYCSECGRKKRKKK